MPDPAAGGEMPARPVAAAHPVMPRTIDEALRARR